MHVVTFVGLAILPSTAMIGHTLWRAYSGELIKFGPTLAAIAVVVRLLVVLAWLGVAAGFARVVFRNGLRWRSGAVTAIVALVIGSWLGFGPMLESAGEPMHVCAYFLSALPLGLMVFGRAQVATQGARPSR